MGQGISLDSHQWNFKSRKWVCKDQTDDRAGKEKQSPGVCSRIPICYRENCLLYIPENLKATLKGSREEVEQLAGQIRDLVCSTLGIHWYCLHLIP